MVRRQLACVSRLQPKEDTQLTAWMACSEGDMRLRAHDGGYASRDPGAGHTTRISACLHCYGGDLAHLRPAGHLHTATYSPGEHRMSMVSTLTTIDIIVISIADHGWPAEAILMGSRRRSGQHEVMHPRHCPSLQQQHQCPPPCWCAWIGWALCSTWSADGGRMS